MLHFFYFYVSFMRRIEHFPFIITPRSDHTTNVLREEKKSRNLNAQKEPLSHNYFQFFYSFFSIIIQQVTRCDRFRSNRIYSVLTAVEWPFQLPLECVCVWEKKRENCSIIFAAKIDMCTRTVGTFRTWEVNCINRENDTHSGGRAIDCTAFHS